MPLSTITLSQAKLARVGLEGPSPVRSQRKHRCRTVFVCDAQQREHANSAGCRAGAESLSLSLASLLVALSADAATGVQETVESTAAKLPSPPPASSVLQPSTIDQAVSSVVDVVRAGGDAFKSFANAAEGGLQYAQQAYGKAAPVLKNAADTASPYVKSALTTAQDVAAPALKGLEPTLKGGLNEAQRFLSSQGLAPPSNLVNKAEKAGSVAESAFTSAKPSLTSSLTNLSSKDPGTLAEYALGVIALYYLGPPFLRGVFGSLRGYAGEINPAAALDAVSTDGNTYIIDIRTSREKENGGLPDLPSSSRLVEVEYAEIEDRKVRNQLQNVGAIERQVTALQIASLRKVNRRSSILLLDKSGTTSKAIAKELRKKGFKRVRVVQGGFSGWTSSKLKTKMSNSVSAVEILAPVFGTVRRGADQTKTVNSRALPSGR